jgi:hypothetical protein
VAAQAEATIQAYRADSPVLRNAENRQAESCPQSADWLSASVPCMFQTRSAIRSVKPGRDRPCLGARDAVGQQDPPRLSGSNSDSRQSLTSTATRRNRRSSHSQGRDATMSEPLRTVVGIDVSKDTIDTATEPPTRPLILQTDKGGLRSESPCWTVHVEHARLRPAGQVIRAGDRWCDVLVAAQFQRQRAISRPARVEDGTALGAGDPRPRRGLRAAK